MAEANNIEKKARKRKAAFIISPIGSEGSNIRRRIEGILKVLLNPVLDNLGFKSLPSHKIDESGSITRQIIEHLLNDDLVICDLTFNNPNVMYELAVRHAVHRPVVSIAEEGTKIPFDISDQRTSFFINDPLGLEEFKPILERKIKSALEQDKFENPITRVIGYENILKRVSLADDDTQKYLVNEISEMRKTLQRMATQPTLPNSEKSHRYIPKYSALSVPNNRKIELKGPIDVCFGKLKREISKLHSVNILTYSRISPETVVLNIRLRSDGGKTFDLHIKKILNKYDSLSYKVFEK